MSRVAGARAGIVVTGTELLTGRVVDRNGPWLAERLGELGVEVLDVLLVGDRPDDLEAALRFQAGRGVDLVVTSGGLGPTADDLTADAVARFAGVDLVLDEAMERRIATIVAGFAGRRREPPGGRSPARNIDPDGRSPALGIDTEALRVATRKQAMVPSGAAVVAPAGTAPGLVVPVPDGPTVIVLPGPPRELQAMWDAAVATAPARTVLGRARPRRSIHLRLFGLAESDIAATLREVGARLDLSRLEIVTCLRDFELEVDVRGGPESDAASAQLVEEIRARHGRFLVSTDGSSVDEVLAGLLTGHRLGLAESCTGGLLAGRISARPGSSAHLAGSVVAYSNRAKVELLGVPAALIEQHGAVSPEVATAMATGALRRFGADVACAVTGVAGPGGGTRTKPVGYVCFCARAADGRTLARDPVLPGGRADVRDRSVVVAMHLLRRLLLGEGRR